MTSKFLDAPGPKSKTGLLGNEGEERVKATYGTNYERLVALKSKYDPMNLFRFNQNIKPDGSDDPPVLADVDTQFSSWVRCAPSFSQHVCAWMWDYALVLGKLRGDDLIDDLVIEALSQPLSEESLGFVRNHFQAELVTHGWPGDTQYRFFTGDQRILIWDSKTQADRFLSAKSTEALGQLANLVSPFNGLAGVLYSPLGSMSGS